LQAQRTDPSTNMAQIYGNVIADLDCVDVARVSA
jgi:hypothetical protein